MPSITTKLMKSQNLNLIKFVSILAPFAFVAPASLRLRSGQALPAVARASCPRSLGNTIAASLLKIFLARILIRRHRIRLRLPPHANDVTHKIVQLLPIQLLSVVRGHRRLTLIIKFSQVRPRQKMKRTVLTLQLHRKIVLITNDATDPLTSPCGCNRHPERRIRNSGRFDDHVGNVFCRTRSAISRQIRPEKAALSLHHVARRALALAEEDRPPPPPPSGTRLSFFLPLPRPQVLDNRAHLLRGQGMKRRHPRIRDSVGDDAGNLGIRHARDARIATTPGSRSPPRPSSPRQLAHDEPNSPCPTAS